MLGMGLMGRALATRLLDTGHEVTVWNRSPGRAAEVVARGASEAASPQEAATGAEVVVAVVTDDRAVRAVLLPAGAPLDVPAVLDCSTVSPATTTALAGVYGDRFGACPILGGPAATASGDAAIVVGGPAALLGRLEPLLSSMSSARRVAGADPAAATTVKLLANYLLLGGLALVSEAAAAGQAAGLPDELLVDFFGTAVAPSLRNRVGDIVAGDHAGWFPTTMGAKDIHLFLDAATSAGADTPVAAAIAARYDQAASSDLGQLDVAAIVELARRRR